MINTVKLIQFHNHTEDSDGRGLRDFRAKWYFLDDEDTEEEFYDCDDEDTGEAIYTYKRCVSYFDNFHDFVHKQNAGYMISKRLSYSIIELDVEFDELNNIKWNI